MSDRKAEITENDRAPVPDRRVNFDQRKTDNNTFYDGPARRMTVDRRLNTDNQRKQN